MVEKRTIESIDACRPGRDDLALSDMKELSAQIRDDVHVADQFRQIQRLDARIQAAIGDVDVPHGLAERIIERVVAADSAATGSNTATGSNIATGSNTATGPTVTTRSGEVSAVGLDTNRTATITATAGDGDGDGVPSRRMWQRRRWVVLSFVVAASLLVAAAIGLFRPNADPLTTENINERAQEWYHLVDQSAWKEDRTRPEIPLPENVAKLVQRWQPLPIGKHGTAFDLGTDPRVTLIAVRGRVSGLPMSPPKRPYSTAGRIFAAWQEGNYVYVLVMEADDQEMYRRLVDTRPKPLA